jgi:geranylgeranyl pyrophosphate synthase
MEAIEEPKHECKHEQDIIDLKEGRQKNSEAIERMETRQKKMKSGIQQILQNLSDLTKWKDKKEFAGEYTDKEIDELKDKLEDKADKTTLGDLKDEIVEMRKTFLYGVIIIVLAEIVRGLLG